MWQSFLASMLFVYVHAAALGAELPQPIGVLLAV
jgi:hypothetical protein